jgi:hypothetical protein
VITRDSQLKLQCNVTSGLDVYASWLPDRGLVGVSSPKDVDMICLKKPVGA